MPNFEEQFNIFLWGADTLGLTDPSKPRPVVDLGWTERVRLNLMTVSTKKIGCALLQTIRYFGIPIYITKPTPGGCGAGVWRDLSYVGSGFDPITGKKILEIVGGVSLEYDPSRFEVGHACMKSKEERLNIFIPGHQTLFHELVHAMRKISFKFSDQAATGGLSFYDSKEEFYAVLLQGIYASESGTPVRDSHTQSFEIDPERNGSFIFFKSGRETFEFVRDFCKDHPVFSKRIANIRTRFNPIQAFYRNPNKAKELAKSPLAQQRDKGEPALKAAWDVIRNDFKRADPTAP